MIAQKLPHMKIFLSSRKYLWKKFSFDLGMIYDFCLLPVLYPTVGLFRSWGMERREKEIFPYQWNTLLRSQAREQYLHLQFVNSTGKTGSGNS